MPVPSLMSRINSDIYNVHQMIDRMQRLGVRAPMLLLGGILVALTLEPVLSLVLIATLPLLGHSPWCTPPATVYACTRLPQQSLDRLVRKVQENMTGARVIKALSKRTGNAAVLTKSAGITCSGKRTLQRPWPLPAR